MTYYMRKKIANQIIERFGITPNVIRIRIAKMLLMGKPTFLGEWAEYEFGSISNIYNLSRLSTGELFKIKDTIGKFLVKMISQELRERYCIFFSIWILRNQTRESHIEMSVKVK